MKTSVSQVVWLVILFGLGTAVGVGADRVWRARSESVAAQGRPADPKAAPAEDDEEPEPAAVVRTAVAAQGELPRTIEVVGTAVVPLIATSVESWPADIVVNRVLVQPGDEVAKDAPLVQVSTTREAQTQAASAQLAAESTNKSLGVAQERLDHGLATRAEVIAAQAAHDEAQQHLERLQAGLPPADGLLRAHSPGVIGAMHALAGSTILAGTPIVDITADSIVGQVGVDPADIVGLAVGQSLEVTTLDARLGGHWTGTLSLLGRSINPTTRLIDATLSLTGGPFPRAGTALRARASLPGTPGVIIPRVALVPEGDGMIVFVVRDGTAVRAPVTIAQRGDEQVVLASGCAAGDRVVVSGQGQLTTGAVVREVVADPKPAQSNGGTGADR